MDDDCVFCAKIRNNGDEHGAVFATSDPGTVRFEPLNPVTPGHMLFVPRRHDWHSYNIGCAFHAADQWARRTYEHDAYNLIVSHGAAATQTVMHPHVHFVPRRPGDGLPMPWTPVSKVTGRMLHPVAGKIESFGGGGGGYYNPPSFGGNAGGLTPH